MELPSFISEHTAEYILVPDLLRRLEPLCQRIIPMYFWSTREGNRTASQTMDGISVRLLAAFARRPKVSTLHSQHITMKINQQLLDYARASTRWGVPVVAGIPLVPSLSMLRPSSPCAWYHVQPLSDTDGDHFIEMDSRGAVVCERPRRTVPSEPLTDVEIIALFNEARIYLWNHAVQFLREARRSTLGISRFPFFGGYRPLHLVLVMP